MFGASYNHSPFEQPPSYSDSMASRSYYFIKNQQNGLYVTLHGSTLRPSGVIASTQQPEGRNDAQLWYDDPATATIRSKANNMCLDVEGERVILSNHQPGSSTQLWERCGNSIRRRTTPNIVMAIGGGAGSMSPIVAQMSSGAWPQVFDFLFWYPPMHAIAQAVAPAYGIPVFTPAPEPFKSYFPPVPSTPSSAEMDFSLRNRRFYIVSEHNNKVLDIKGGNSIANTPIIMWDSKPRPEDNQLWYFDSQGFIYSSLNHFVFHPGPNGRLVMTPYRADPVHQWSFSGNRIMNRSNQCLDIVGENRNAGAELCAYHYKGSSNQHWRIQYV